MINPRILSSRAEHSGSIAADEEHTALCPSSVITLRMATDSQGCETNVANFLENKKQLFSVWTRLWNIRAKIVDFLSNDGSMNLQNLSTSPEKKLYKSGKVHHSRISRKIARNEVIKHKGKRRSGLMVSGGLESVSHLFVRQPVRRNVLHFIIPASNQSQQIEVTAADKREQINPPNSIRNPLAATRRHWSALAGSPGRDAWPHSRDIGLPTLATISRRLPSRKFAN